jgi:L-amino acid N-acyltransferase YncA
MADVVVIREAQHSDITEIVSIYDDVLATTSAV